MWSHDFNKYLIPIMFAPILSGYDFNVSAAEVEKIPTANGTNLFTHEIAQNAEKPDSRAWSEVVGRTVVVQGVVWGAFEKSHGPYVMMNQSVVYIESDTFPALKLQGTMIELEGELLIEHYEPMKNAASPKGKLQVYKIKPARMKQLSRITWPWMRSASEAGK